MVADEPPLRAHHRLRGRARLRFAKWAILSAVYAGGDVIMEAGLALEARALVTLFTSAMVRGRVDRMDATITEHEGILEALRGDDEAAFCTVVDDHLRWSTEPARKSH